MTQKSGSRTVQAALNAMKGFGVKSSVLEPPLSENIFVPIMKDEHMLDHLPLVEDASHPVQKKGIEGKGAPVHTNKFYANAFLGNQDQPIWTHPYHIWWGRGNVKDQFQTWGMNVGHIDEMDLIMPEPAGDVDVGSPLVLPVFYDTCY